METESVLGSARYGKDNVRIFRVVRNGLKHQIVEYNVRVLVEGNIATSYTEADNSVIVATDSMKNITYYLAKVSPHILIPEHFALHLGAHILSKYAHLTKAIISIEKLRWSPILVGVDGQEGPHPHSFVRDGEDKAVVEAEVENVDGKLMGRVTAGIKDLLVLKSTGSAFAGFIRDEYTTLAEVNDRIFSTSVDASFEYSPFEVSWPGDGVLKVEMPKEVAEAEKVAESVRRLTLNTFATDNSASVQATLFKMGQRVLAENMGIRKVWYQLPNKHYVPVDMKYIGMDNTTPSNAEVFIPVSAPSGLISATICRK